MSWNFAALWWINDLGPVLRELARIARKVVLICVPNKNGLGLWARRAFYIENVAKMKIDYIDPIRIKSALSQLGWEVRDEGFFDVPPWPDIAMKKEDFLRKMKMGRVASRMESKEFDADSILDFYRGSAPYLEKQVLKYAILKMRPDFSKTDGPTTGISFSRRTNNFGTEKRFAGAYIDDNGCHPFI